VNYGKLLVTICQPCDLMGGININRNEYCAVTIQNFYSSFIKMIAKNPTILINFIANLETLNIMCDQVLYR